MPDNAETKRADEVLRPGQFVHLGIPDEDAEDGLRIMQGRLIELALRYFAVELKCPVKDFLSSPDAGT